MYLSYDDIFRTDNIEVVVLLQDLERVIITPTTAQAQTLKTTGKHQTQAQTLKTTAQAQTLKTTAQAQTLKTTGKHQTQTVPVLLVTTECQCSTTQDVPLECQYLQHRHTKLSNNKHLHINQNTYQ